MCELRFGLAPCFSDLKDVSLLRPHLIDVLAEPSWMSSLEIVSIDSDDSNLWLRAKARAILSWWLHRLQSIAEQGQREAATAIELGG
jgi:hypothetical protein